VEARLSARSIRRLAAAAFAGAVALAAPAAAESIKIGLLRVPAAGPV
jgi:hypothetical protein